MPQPLLISTKTENNRLRTANSVWRSEDDLMTDASPIDQPTLSAWHSFITTRPPFFKERQSYAQLCENMYFTSTPSITELGVSGYLCSWVEKKNSFTYADVLENYEDELQSLILRYKTSLSVTSQYREKLSNRIAELLRDLEEDEDNISIDSLNNFYNFCQLNKGLKFPDISLIPDGNIYVSWSGEKNRVLSILFLSKGNVHFALLEPNERYPERQNILSGELTFDTIMDKVKPYNVMSWIGE